VGENVSATPFESIFDPKLISDLPKYVIKKGTNQNAWEISNEEKKNVILFENTKISSLLYKGAKTNTPIKSGSAYPRIQGIEYKAKENITQLITPKATYLYKPVRIYFMSRKDVKGIKGINHIVDRNIKN
jgi:hypothetical protein